MGATMGATGIGTSGRCSLLQHQKPYPDTDCNTQTTMRRLWVTPVVLSLVLVLLYCSIAPVDYTPHSDVSWHIDSKSNGTIHSAFGQKPHTNAFCMAFCASADAGEHCLYSKNSTNLGANSGCMVTLFLKLSLTLTLTHAI